MGLSSKQVCSSGLDWKQTLLESQDLELPKPHHLMKKQETQVQSAECLKCPRCDSANTKFCYYNNYNKSQPRYFCRACKRHWTKGGTLRNVPVGGGRKNKRLKKSTNSISSTTTTTSNSNMNGGFSSHMTDQKNMPSSFYQALTQPPSMILQQNMMNTRNYEGNSMFTTSTLSLPQNNSLLFPFLTSSSFDTTTCSSSNVYYYGGEEFKAMEEPTINSVVPSTKPWEIPATSGGMEASKYWNWEDIDSLVSTDIKDPWDDSDIKP